jgi:rsbT co-antagonist protein RsbR
MQHRFEQAVLITSICLLVLAVGTTILNPAASASNAICVLIAVALAIQYLGRRTLRILLVCSWFVVLVVLLLRQTGNNSQALDPAVVVTIEMSVFLLGAGVLMFLLWQHYIRLNQIVDQLRLSNTELHQSRALLEVQVLERTSDLQLALHDVQQRSDAQARLLAEVEQQRTTIRELSVPIIPIDDQTLIMPLVGSFDSQRLNDIREQALHAIERENTHVLIFDITGVPVVDSHIAQGLIAIVHAARLLGTQTILVGIRPEVAQSIVGLGLDMSDLRTEGSLQQALVKRN